MPDRPFSPARFRFYAAALAESLHQLSRETMGGNADLQSRLGIENVRVRYGDNRQFITMTNPDGTETTAELDVNASTADIAKALNVEEPKAIDTPAELPPNNITADLPAPVAAAKPTEPIKRNLTGASYLAGVIRSQQAQIKQQLAQAGTDMTAAIKELQDIANEATNQVKAVQAETADLKAALGLNSNGEPS